MTLSQAHLDEIRLETATGEKFIKSFSVEVLSSLVKSWLALKKMFTLA